MLTFWEESFCFCLWNLIPFPNLLCFTSLKSSEPNPPITPLSTYDFGCFTLCTSAVHTRYMCTICIFFVTINTCWINGKQGKFLSNTLERAGSRHLHTISKTCVIWFYTQTWILKSEETYWYIHNALNRKRTWSIPIPNSPRSGCREWEEEQGVASLGEQGKCGGGGVNHPEPIMTFNVHPLLIWRLLAPQSVALRRGAYRDFHPIPSNL